MVGGTLSGGSIPLCAAVPDLEEHPHRPASAIIIIGDRRAEVITEHDEPRSTAAVATPIVGHTRGESSEGSPFFGLGNGVHHIRFMLNQGKSRISTMRTSKPRGRLDSMVVRRHPLVLVA